MSGVDIKKLMDVADQTEQTELKLAHNGHVQAMTAYQTKSGRSTKEDLDASRAYYDETVDRLTNKYFPDEIKTPLSERFKTRQEALVWINAQGYKVSRGKFFGDCKKGFPGVHKDKTVSRYQVMQYAQQLNAELRSSPTDHSEREAELKIRKLEAEVEALERKSHKEDARWMEVVEHEIQMAGLAGLFEETLQQQITINLSRLIYQSGGDISRAAEFALELDNVIALAMTEAVREQIRLLAFEDEEDAADANSYEQLAEKAGIGYSPAPPELRNQRGLADVSK